MDQKSTVEQLARIIMYMLGPLLTQWGYNANEAAVQIAGVVVTVGAFLWWLLWQRKRKPD